MLLPSIKLDEILFMLFCKFLYLNYTLQVKSAKISFLSNSVPFHKDFVSSGSLPPSILNYLLTFIAVDYISTIGSTHPYEQILKEKIKDFKKTYDKKVNHSIDELYTMLKGKLSRIRSQSLHGSKGEMAESIPGYDHFAKKTFDARRAAIGHSKRKNRLTTLTEKYTIFQSISNVLILFWKFILIMWHKV